MKDEYGRKIPEEAQGLIDTDARPLQHILDSVGPSQYGKQSARYFSRFVDKQRPRYAKR